MLTQHEVRAQLDTFANEVLQPPGLYYELFSRLFSERVHRWIDTAPGTEAELIKRVAAQDPDYSPDTELIAKTHALHEPLFNPAWDVDY